MDTPQTPKTTQPRQDAWQVAHQGGRDQARAGAERPAARGVKRRHVVGAGLVVAGLLAAGAVLHDTGPAPSEAGKIRSVQDVWDHIEGFEERMKNKALDDVQRKHAP